MANNLPKHLADFATKYGLNPAVDMWEVRSGAYAVLHKALERVAVAEKVVFEPPLVLTSNYHNEGIAICVTGHMGDAQEWSIGEASAKDNYKTFGKQAAYPWAIAEKRAKDRVILKLVQLHGELYSEAEIDEERPTMLAKKDAKEIFDKLQTELKMPQNVEDLGKWAKDAKGRIEILPEDWADIIRLKHEERYLELKQRQV